MATGRWLIETGTRRTALAGNVMRVIRLAFVVVAVFLAAYWIVRSRVAQSAAPSPSVAPIIVSPTQNVHQTVQVIIPGGAAPSQAPSLSADPSRTQAAVPVTVASLMFEVRACRHAVSGIQCDFQVTNTGDEMHLRVSAYADSPDLTVAFDSGGVARTVMDARFAGVGRTGYSVEARLSPNVPTPLVVFFENTSSPAFTAITLGIFVPQAGRMPVSKAVVFRNVRIES
jgi:hypothetical protein